ncbi:MAG: DDE-type integrase/transposase/recombinase, partial [Patescibacteria group bacterium]|nr:DDE-type integrase/transposase/recombinase [Patescibacteria group bacterium]
MDDNWYQVKAQSLSYDSWYDVVATEAGFVCDCPDYQYRKAKCKHIYAVEFSRTIRKEIWKHVTISPASSQSCPSCGSENIVKKGLRKNKYGNIQKFQCRDCNKWFVFNLGFERMRASPEVITSAMQLYFSGESLRNVTNFLKLKGIKISHVAVYKWIKKYVKLMESYLENITPQLSDVWRADKMFVKIKGNMKYVYALMDDETRFWIAKQVSDTKFTEDVTPMFAKGREVAGKNPLALITDGAPNFHKAWKKEFRTMNKPRTVHISSITLKGEHNNNKMERLNGEIRDREKVMRGLKRDDSSIIDGYRIYHNFVRPHQGLDGKTPADIASITVEGQNKWLTIIQNASKVTKV